MSTGFAMIGEAQALAQLASMEVKLKQGPTVALGIGPAASADAVRKAFLEQTKAFHPNRFARFSTPTQVRANTVFLAIKRAHDELAKGVRASSASLTPPRDAAGERPSLETIARPSLPTVAPAVAPTGTPAVAAPGAARSQAEVAAAARSRRPSAVPQWLPQGTRARTTSSPQSAPVVPGGPGGPNKGAVPATGSLPGKTAAPLAPTAAPAPAGARQAGTPTRPPPPRSPEELKFDDAKLAINQQRWLDADALLGELAIAQPMEKKFRVFRHFVRGRLAHEENRIADARQEYERALALDATFASARIALGQLPASGFLGRLFKR